MGSALIRAIATDQFSIECKRSYSLPGMTGKVYSLSQPSPKLPLYKRYQSIVEKACLGSLTEIRRHIEDARPAVEKVCWRSHIAARMSISDQRTFAVCLPSAGPAEYHFHHVSSDVNEVLHWMNHQFLEVRQYFLDGFFSYAKSLPRISHSQPDYPHLDVLDSVGYAFWVIDEQKANLWIEQPPTSQVEISLIQQTLNNWGYQPVSDAPRKKDLILYLTKDNLTPSLLGVYLGSGMAQSKWRQDGPSPTVHPIFECPFFDHHVVFYRKPSP